MDTGLTSYLTTSWHSPQDIDEIISGNLFKKDNDEGRKGALLGVIDLKARVLLCTSNRPNLFNVTNN